LAQVLVVVVIRPQGILAVAKVLVVVDDPAVQMMTCLVQRAGHTVVVAEDGNKGFAACSMVTQCFAGVTHTSPDRNVASSR
jgi:CheY-like chemotaxis protein